MSQNIGELYKELSPKILHAFARSQSKIEHRIFDDFKSQLSGCCLTNIHNCFALKDNRLLSKFAGELDNNWRSVYYRNASTMMVLQEAKNDPFPWIEVRDLKKRKTFLRSMSPN